MRRGGKGISNIARNELQLEKLGLAKKKKKKKKEAVGDQNSTRGPGSGPPLVEPCGRKS
jgi:hypothetical protein